MKLKNPLLAELNKWAYADDIIDVFVQSKSMKVSSNAPISGPLTGEGIGMGASGINAKVIELKEEYIEEYGLLTTEEAKLIIKAIFPEKISARMLEPESYNDEQLKFALDVGANALVVDYDSFLAQANRLKPWGMIKAALDLWDTPDADEYRDELNDGFDDLSVLAKGVIERYKIVAMGHGSIPDYFFDLK